MQRSETLAVREVYTGPDYSLANVTLRGINKATRNRDCLLSYTVREGNGWMNVEGEMYELRPGITIEVRPGQSYQDAGFVVMLARSEPPFDPAQAEEVEPLLCLSMHDELTLSSQFGHAVV